MSIILLVAAGMVVFIFCVVSTLKGASDVEDSVSSIKLIRIALSPAQCPQGITSVDV